MDDRPHLFYKLHHFYIGTELGKSIELEHCCIPYHLCIAITDLCWISHSFSAPNMKSCSKLYCLVTEEVTQLGSVIIVIKTLVLEVKWQREQRSTSWSLVQRPNHYITMPYKCGNVLKSGMAHFSTPFLPSPLISTPTSSLISIFWRKLRKADIIFHKIFIYMSFLLQSSDHKELI